MAIRALSVYQKADRLVTQPSISSGASDRATRIWSLQYAKETLEHHPLTFAEKTRSSTTRSPWRLFRSLGLTYVWRLVANGVLDGARLVAGAPHPVPPRVDHSDALVEIRPPKGCGDAVAVSRLFVLCFEIVFEPQYRFSGSDALS